MEREKGRDLARGFIAIGLVLSGWALFLVYDIQSFVDRAVLARGQVIAIQSYAQVEGASTFQP
jgi:hypothetical protein